MYPIKGLALNTPLKKFLTEINAIEVIPPDNGSTYLLDTIMHVGEGEIVRISERARNLAVIMATEKISVVHAGAKAGYSLSPRSVALLGPASTVKVIRNNFKQKFNQAYTIKVQKLQHFIERDACKAIGIDATWVLGQQISLFEACKRKGDNTNAVRLLNDISMHVEIDSRVSNRLTIENTVDYAALLQEADNRSSIIEHEVIAIESE